MKVGTRVRSVSDHSLTGELVGNGWQQEQPVILVRLDKGGYLEGYPPSKSPYVNILVSLPEYFEEV